jgi:CRP-like cAMP-binding protein
MPRTKEPRIRVTNNILASLPEKDFARLQPHAEVTALTQGNTLYEPNEFINYVYFPNDAVISLISISESGATIEVGMIGNEGIVGLPIILGETTMLYRATVQIPGNAVRIPAELVKKEFKYQSELHKQLLRYTYTLLTQVSQSAVCNRFHTVEKRLCRWLLVTHDRVKCDDLQLTQELLALMLGTRRAGVSVAAGILQKAGLIRYSRGHIKILDRTGLESATCECYHIIKDQFDHFMNE